MRKNQFNLEAFNDLVEIISRLDDGQWFEFGGKGISFQCYDQEQVKKVRAAVKADKWEKKYNEGCAWWEYIAEKDGAIFRIYACKEAPPTCKAVVKKKTITKKVPVTFEEIEEEVEVVEWDCGNGQV